MDNQETQHFLPQEKLVKLTNKRIDTEAVRNIQTFTEKIITDIINRSALLARHNNNTVIGAKEISIIIEKDFDYSFGQRALLGEKNLPSSEHVDRLAELSKQKQY